MLESESMHPEIEARESAVSDTDTASRDKAGTGESSGRSVAEQRALAPPGVADCERPRGTELASLLARISSDPAEVHAALEDLQEIVGERVLREVRAFKVQIDGQFKVVNTKFEALSTMFGPLSTKLEGLVAAQNVLIKAQDTKIEALRAEFASMRRENRLLMALLMLLIALGIFDRFVSRRVPERVPAVAVVATPESDITDPSRGT